MAFGTIDPVFYLQLMRACYSKPESEWTPLSQKNFSDGTFRIVKSGCYFLAEDIEFAPNIDCCDYWPRVDAHPTIQVGGETQLLYPQGPYSLGFFAAITVEADDVVLDLNTKTIFASPKMVLKQVSSSCSSSNRPFWVP